MAGIEFDRQVFASPETPRKAPPKLLGMVLLVLALALAGIVGYKVFTQVTGGSSAAANAQVEHLQQRLADVVGAVGQQQNELSETRETVNQLVSQTRREALAFELQRGNNRMPVGPVTLQLKSVDPKSRRYSVCVYVDDRCIELKDRVLNEVVVYVVSKDTAPLELVATKVLHDQIVG